MLHLQRALGNREVARLLQAQRLPGQGDARGLQRKLMVGAAGGQYEQEADAVARQVLSLTNAAVERSMQRAAMPEEEDKDKLKTQAVASVQKTQRQATVEEEKELLTKPLGEKISRLLQPQRSAEEDQEELVQLKAAKSQAESFEAGEELERQIGLSKGGGSPLPDTVRGFMEPRFGMDFSHVRVHTSREAVQMNEAVGAQAFTHGRDIYFGAGHSPGELALTAHELTHVIQQNGASMPTGSQANRISRLCGECAEEQAQTKLIVGAPGDVYEREADALASRAIRMAQLGSSAAKEKEEERVQVRSSGPSIQRIPAPGRNFGTYRYCGFGITTPIPGFIKGMVTEGFEVDYTTGCRFVGWNAWDSVWELYDASGKVDSNEEAPHGDYTIPAEKLNSGTPSDGTSSKWSLWYRITESNPWVSDDNDAYPYDYKTFDVYSAPIRDPQVNLKTEKGPPCWQYGFTPAEDGASFEYNFATTAHRSTEESQEISISGTVGGGRETQAGFNVPGIDGLTGGFSRNLNYSATASISKTKGVSVSTTKTDAFNFSQGNLRAGVTYTLVARPVYYVLDGSVQVIPHRDGVISSGSNRIEGGIRVFNGLDFKVETEEEAETLAKKKWGCEDVRCNVYKVDPEAECPERVIGRSDCVYGSYNDACKAAEKDANRQVPRGCNKRHCNCKTKCKKC